MDWSIAHQAGKHTLFDKNSEVKVSDLGIVKFVYDGKEPLNLRQGPRQDNPNKCICGHRRLCSTRAVDWSIVHRLRVDIWSFGVILYEMVTGIHPFLTADKPVPEAIMYQEPRSWNAFKGSINQTIHSIVKKCLQKDRDNRYRTFEDLARTGIKQSNSQERSWE